MKRILKHFLNWKFLISFGLAWLIMHGWSFVFVFLGGINEELSWMLIPGGFWVGLIMMPNGFGILATIPLATVFQLWFFPTDTKLIEDLRALKEEKKAKNAERKAKREQKRQEKLKQKESSSI